MSTVNYAVEGLTCGDCVAEVLESIDTMREATESSRFDLTITEGREMRQRADSPSSRDSNTHPDHERMTSSTGSVKS